MTLLTTTTVWRPPKWIGMRRVRFTTTAGLVIELVEARSRRVPFPGGSVRESWAPQPQASCGTAQGNWRGKRGEKVQLLLGP